MHTALHYRPRLRYRHQPGVDPNPGVIPAPAPPNDPTNVPPPAGFVAQDEVTRIAAEQKDRGERAGKAAADQALKDKLGDLSLDDLLAAHQAQKEADDAKKTEAQKALEAANTVKAEAERDRKAAAELLHATRVTAALAAAGAPAKAHAALNVPVAVGATDEEIKTAVDALKADLPGLFTTAPAAPSDPGKGPGHTPPPGEVGQAGLAEFERRYPKTA